MMIQCPVCSVNNDDLLLRCTSCGSNIQERVPNLNLFSTVWLLIESPTAACKKIILAEQKNYIFLLTMFGGIAAAFAMLWGIHIGDRLENVFYIMAIGILSGCVVGFPLLFVMTYAVHWLLSIVHGKGTIRNTLAILSWSFVPIMLSVVFILPLELATLGSIFFSTNPHPFDVKPEVYSVLIGLDGMAVVWSILLATLGVRMEQRTTFSRAMLSIVIVLSGTAYACFEIIKIL